MNVELLLNLADDVIDKLEAKLYDVDNDTDSSTLELYRSVLTEKIIALSIKQNDSGSVELEYNDLKSLATSIDYDEELHIFDSHPDWTLYG